MSARVQEPAPQFSGQAYFKGEFKQVSLSDYAGQYVVLFFYPLDFTFVCPTEIVEFSNQTKNFNATNCAVVGCSVDSHFSHRQWCHLPRNKGGLGEMEMPLLSDLTKQISEDYGVLIKSAGVALRGTFIIDGKGVLRHSSINDLPVGRNVEETLRLVKAFQYTDEFGEVCPAKWAKKGDSTMVPGINQAKTDQYFEQVHSQQ